MPWKPEVPGEVPTLGYLAIDWMKAYLAAPDRTEYEPFIPYIEQEDFENSQTHSIFELVYKISEKFHVSSFADLDFAEPT